MMKPKSYQNGNTLFLLHLQRVVRASLHIHMKWHARGFENKRDLAFSNITECGRHWASLHVKKDVLACMLVWVFI